MYYAISGESTGDDNIYSSDNLRSWDGGVEAKPGLQCCSIATDGTRVVIGANRVSGSTDRIAYSDNGASFTYATGLPSSTSSINCIVYDSGTWYAVGEDSEIYVSDDGAVWVAKTAPYAGRNLRSVAVHDNKVIAVSVEADVFVSEDNGDTWSSITGSIISSSAMQSVCWAPHLEKWVIVGADGKTWLNDDDFTKPIYWVSQMPSPQGTSVSLRKVICYDGMIVTIGTWSIALNKKIAVYVCENPSDENGWRYSDAGDYAYGPAESKSLSVVGGNDPRLVIGCGDPALLKFSNRI